MCIYRGPSRCLCGACVYVLSQSAVAEGGELFPALMAHLRRRYPEVYSSAVATYHAPDRREIQIREGGGLSGGARVHSSIKLGAYAGTFTNISLAEMNNPIPNLTTFYLDTPLMGPTLDPLESVPSIGHLGQPSRYPPSSTGGGPQTGISNRCPATPPPSYNTHPRMNPPTGQAQPRRVMQL